MNSTDPDSPDAYGLSVDDQIRLFVDDHRRMLDQSLDGLTEEQVRRELVESKTTLLGQLAFCFRRSRHSAMRSGRGRTTWMKGDWENGPRYRIGT